MEHLEEKHKVKENVVVEVITETMKNKPMDIKSE